MSNGSTRLAEGVKIAQRGHQIRTILDSYGNVSHFMVKSQSKDKNWYKVRFDEGRWKCKCPDNGDGFSRAGDCKHIKAVRIRQCPSCDSYHARNRGTRYTVLGEMLDIQCMNCGHGSSISVIEATESLLRV